MIILFFLFLGAFRTYQERKKAAKLYYMVKKIAFNKKISVTQIKSLKKL